MASAAATSALGTETLAVQRLFYDITPNPGASIFLLFASQLIGYGIAGVMRRAANSYMSRKVVNIGTCSDSAVPIQDAVPRSAAVRVVVSKLFS